jgi:hypothetical protein
MRRILRKIAEDDFSKLGDSKEYDNTVEASNLTLSILSCFAKQNVNKDSFVFVRIPKGSYSGCL